MEQMDVVGTLEGYAGRTVGYGEGTGRGYAGGTDGYGGALCCKGAMLLQWLQFAFKAVIAGVMPSQKTVASACANMEVTPWFAERSI